MFVGGSRGTGHPYPVPYRAITPKAGECGNLLVPVCFSATYIAYASARMEPAFCVLGESAGVAAAQSTKAGVTVQKLDVATLRNRLVERGQVLKWKDSLRFPQLQTEWSSREEWNPTKPGWEWLFPCIDKTRTASSRRPIMRSSRSTRSSIRLEQTAAGGAACRMKRGRARFISPRK